MKIWNSNRYQERQLQKITTFNERLIQFGRLQQRDEMIWITAEQKIFFCTQTWTDRWELKIFIKEKKETDEQLKADINKIMEEVKLERKCE